MFNSIALFYIRIFYLSVHHEKTTQARKKILLYIAVIILHYILLCFVRFKHGENITTMNLRFIILDQFAFVM